MSSESCNCPDGTGPQAPRALDNRAGMSAIGYRVGDYAQFRASMHASLSLSAFGSITQLRTRDSEDFTIGLIDAFACVADVITFYQERIANESWLRTASERISLQEMGKLVGYRLRPGVAAETWLAFALETPPKPPANLPPEPGNFVTGIPERITLDRGLKVQSIPGPEEKPQTFETVEAIDARPEWNAMRPWLSAPARPASGDTSVWLVGLADRPKANDGILFLGDTSAEPENGSAWDFREIEAVEHDAESNKTRVSWKVALDSIPAVVETASPEPAIHLFRKRASVFGHNAPMWETLSADFRGFYPGAIVAGGAVTSWPAYNASPEAPEEDGGDLDLDNLYPDVHKGGFAVLKAASSRWEASELGRARRVRTLDVGLYRIEGTSEVSRAQFALSGKVTRLQLAGKDYESRFWKRVRETGVYLQSEPVAAAERPVDTPVVGSHVPVSIAGHGLHAGRRLIVRGVRELDGSEVVHAATLVAVHLIGPSRITLEIAPALPSALRRDSVVVHANVALASHGESVTQVLGAGDASAVFQSFELKHAPLTYRAARNELGAASELTVRVGNIAWTELDTLYGSKPTERAFVLAVDEQDRNHVVFGDGINGARLPSGVNNLVATYRKGLGAAGNLAAGKLTQLTSRPLGLKSVSNLLPADGGTDPEAAASARSSIPLTARTLGRVVSVLDYEDFSRAFSGIAKSQACVLQAAGGTTVAITLAADKGVALTSSNPVWKNLYGTLRASGDPHVAVQLLSYLASTFKLGLRVKCDPAHDRKAVLTAVDAALRSHFSFAARALGQPVQQSEVFSVVHRVDGVLAVDITRLFGGSLPVQASPSTQLRLLASRAHVVGGVIRPAELLTLDPAPLLELEAMP